MNTPAADPDNLMIHQQQSEAGKMTSNDDVVFVCIYV